MESDLDDDIVPVPRAARFPIELRPPAGFRPTDPGTWPVAEGRLEYFRGRLLYMAPCGDLQQDVCVSAVGVLDRWSMRHPEFVVGGNEAGMILGGDVRGADAAVWRRAEVGRYRGKYRRVAPLLAVEVAGQDEGELELREKAAWYLSNGVKTVWLLFPESRQALVLKTGSERRVRGDEHLPATAELPGLRPRARDLFRQLG